MKRLVTAILVAVLGVATFQTSAAQDSRGVRVEIKDGKVLVNGKEVESNDENQIVIETEDGEKVTVHFSEDGNSVWVGDGDEFRGFGNSFIELGDGRFTVDGDISDRLKEMMARVESRGEMRFGDGEDFLFKDGGGRSFFFSDDGAPNVFEDYASHLFGEHAPRGLYFNSETAALERRLNQMARQLRMADEDEKAELEAQLDDLLAEAFDAKIADQRSEAERLEARLQELRDRLDERSSAREEIIAKRKRELLGKRDVLDW